MDFWVLEKKEIEKLLNKSVSISISISMLRNNYSELNYADLKKHFKNINVDLNEKDFQELNNRINEFKSKKFIVEQEKLVKSYKEGKIPLGELIEKTKQLDGEMKEPFVPSNPTFPLNLKNLVNHFYIPLIISKNEKIDYINHIINVPSEVEFISDLETSIKDIELFKKFDWWMFSKLDSYLDSYLDSVYIPYHNKEHNKIEKFKPDFIFWFKKKNKLYIIFIDPKGFKHTDYEYKLDGYKNIFEKNEKKIIFKKGDLEIEVLLYLYTKDANVFPEVYKLYWKDNFKKILELL